MDFNLKAAAHKILLSQVGRFPSLALSQHCVLTEKERTAWESIVEHLRQNRPRTTFNPFAVPSRNIIFLRAALLQDIVG